MPVCAVFSLVKNYTNATVPLKIPPFPTQSLVSVQTSLANVLTDILLEPDDKSTSYHSLQFSDTDLETIVEPSVETGIEYYDESESEEEYAEEEDQEEDQDQDQHDLSAHALSSSSPMSSVLSDIETSIDIDAIDEDYANGDEYSEEYEPGK